MSRPRLEDLDALIFDFDGVLTDNRVWIDQMGNEQVCCNRSDGLAFDVLRKLDAKAFILSTEKNPVVSARAAKLKVPVIQGSINKVLELKKLSAENNIDLSRVMYIGNDLNDYLPMKLCGFSACPSDSHSKIIDISTYQLRTRGGEGIVREIIENLLDIDIVQVLYSE